MIKPGDYVCPGPRVWPPFLEVGKLYAVDVSTQSHLWFQVVRIEKIIPHETDWRVICYHGKKNSPMLCNRCLTGFYEIRKEDLT